MFDVWNLVNFSRNMRHRISYTELIIVIIRCYYFVTTVISIVNYVTKPYITYEYSDLYYAPMFIMKFQSIN